MKRRFWQIYLFLMIALTLGGIILTVVDPPGNPRDIFRTIADLLLYIAQLVGLFGYIHSRAIAARAFWQLIFVVSVVETVWALSSLFEASMPEVGPIFRVTLAAVMTVIMIPLYVGLYLYAFRRKELWIR